MAFIIIMSTKKVSGDLFLVSIFYVFVCVFLLLLFLFRFLAVIWTKEEMTIYKLCGRTAFRRREWK